MRGQSELSRRQVIKNALSVVGLSLFGVFPASCSGSAQWSLLPPRPVPWTMKPFASAKAGESALDDGRVELRVEHELLRGVTPAMLVWWWRNLDGDIEVAGTTYRRYLIWHPIDHIHLDMVTRAPDGGVGSVIHIVEALGADMRNLVDVRLHLRQLDEREFAVELRPLGRTALRIHVEIAAQPDGTQLVSTMTVGFASAPGAWLNALLIDRYFPSGRRRAWLRHCVEEIGNLEFFLPALYRRRV